MFKFGNASTLANNDSWGRSDIKSVQAFAKEMENGASLGQAWQQTMAGATREAKEFVANGKKAGQTYTEIAASMNATATSAKVATIATTALNAVLTGLVIAAVTFAISKLVKAIDEFIRREEIAAQKAQEARDKINGLKQSFSDNEKTVNSLKQRYAELAQGVDKLGTAFQNQGRLNTEEYAEFLNISNQLADLYPQLTQGYDDNGNAILNLTGSVNTIVGSLDALIERSRQITRMQINEEMDKVWDDDIKNIENYKKEIRDTYTEVNDLAEGGYEVISKGTGYADYLEEYTRLLDLVNHSATKNLSITEDLTNQQRTMIANAMKEVLNLDFDVATDKDGLFDVATIFNFGKLGPENIQKLSDYFQEQIKEYQGLIYQAEDKIAQVNSQMQKNLVDYLSGDAVYLALDENSQRIVQGILSNFDISKIPEEANVESWDDLTRWYQTNIIQSIANIDDKEIQQKIGELFSGEGTLAETKDLYNVIYEYLINQPGFDKDDPIILYLKTQLEDQQTIVDDALNRLLANVSDKDLRQQYAIGLRTLLEGASDEFVNWVANDLTIPEGTIYSEQKLLDMWEELQKAGENLSETDPFATISDSVKQFNTDLKPQFDALETAYQQLFFNEEGFQAGLDSLDIAWFENIRSNFAEISEELGITFDDSYVEEFFRTLESGGEVTEDLAHKAFNELATAYFYSAEGLQNLNDETSTAITQMMKQMGVINAEDVVNNMLSLKYLPEEILKIPQQALQEEYQKIDDWGLSDYAEQIKNHTIQSVFGNVDMDKRTIITWSNELKDTYKDELESWGYDPEIGGIDTVFGGADTFNLNGGSIDVAFTPIMVDEDGNNPKFLDRDTVTKYIQDVLNEATKMAGENASQEDIIALAMKIDNNEVNENGEKYGNIFGRGIIAGIGENAIEISSLMHFSGDYGAIELAEKAMEEIDAVTKSLNKDGKKLEDITQAEINAFREEKTVTEASANTLYYYASMKDLANDGKIDETYNIQTLRDLAVQAGMAGDELLAFYEICNSIDKANTYANKISQVSGTAASAIQQDLEAQKRALQNQIEAKWQERMQLLYEAPKPPSNNGDGGGGGSSEDKDPIVEKFEQDKEHLDWLRDQDLISQQEYLDQLAILIQNSFGDNEKYADKYYEHMHDLMDQTKDYFDTAISAVNTILDKQIDKLEDLEKAEKKPYETANKEIDKNIRKLEKQTTSIDEVTKSLERQKETIQSKKIDPIQRQIDEIERTYIRPIEREIDALEKGKLRDLQDKINGVWGTDGLDDFIEKANREIQSIQDDLIKPIEKQKEAHQKVIDGINEEIQKMQDANQERQTNINLMKSQYELERQMHQRVNLVYTDDDQLGGQMRYRTDPNAVRDAQENLNNAQFELTIQNKQKEIKLIEDQIADLDKIIDQHNESIEKIQERIDGWEKEKQAIQDEIDALNDYIEYLNRSKEPWEQRIQDLQDEMEIYQLQTETIDRQIEQQNEKKQILEDQLDILNKQKDANEEAITLIEEKYEPLKTQLEEYKKLWTDLADTQEYADAIEALNNFGIKTEEILNGSKETFNEFSSAYYSVLKGITDGNAEALAALSTATNGASDAVKPYIEAMSPYLDKLQALDLTDTNTALASARELAGQLGTNFSLAERAAMVLGDTTVGKGGKGGVISAIMTELGDGETPGTLIGAAAEYKNTLDESKTSTEELGTTTTATMDETKSVIDEVGNPALDDLKKHTDDNVTSMTNLKDEVGRLGDMIDSLPDSKDITITIKEVHEKVSVGSASGTSKFNGTVGNAFADGYPGLKSNEKDALRSEFGQPELSVYPNGTYELTTTPTISDLPKGTVIFNGEQTKKILSQNGKKSKAFASGSSQYLSLQDVMPEKAAIFERFNANLQANMEALKMNTFDMSRNVSDIAKAVTTNNFGNNVVVNGGINITCPGVTEAEVARNIAPIIQDQFTSIFSGMALRADQRAMRR